MTIDSLRVVATLRFTVETEKRFECPCCKRISMLLHLSEEGWQEYIEDCEVCCEPIQIVYEARGYKLVALGWWAIQ